MFVESLTFDDVLIKPCASSVLPNQTDISTNLTSSIQLNIPIIATNEVFYINKVQWIQLQKRN